MSQEEIWKDSPVYPDRYEVSNLGRVRSKTFLKKTRNAHGDLSFWTKPRILKQWYDSSGYLQIEFKRDGIRRMLKVHRLVALVFCEGYSKDKQVNHKDSIRDNNIYTNLEWVTAQENVLHSYKEGLNSNKGSKHPRSLLTEKDVKVIRELKEQGLTNKQISEKYDVKTCTIQKITNGKLWRHV